MYATPSKYIKRKCRKCFPYLLAWTITPFLEYDLNRRCTFLCSRCSVNFKLLVSSVEFLCFLNDRNVSYSKNASLVFDGFENLISSFVFFNCSIEDCI